MHVPVPASVGVARPLVGKRITLCVSGSIAAYKAVVLARLLLRAGARVQALMTASAKRFIGAETLSGITGQPVLSRLFQGIGEPHVWLGQSSDLIVIAPATADLLARLAQGRADDLVAATALCARCPVLVAPAMHPTMWAHPLTQHNVERLRQVPGWQLLGPAYGEVASGDTGYGRLLEPDEVLQGIEQALADRAAMGTGGHAARAAQSLGGRHVVVTAGPTVEDIDPVRCLTNRSSGKMGFALAQAAAQRGARVTLIAGPVSVPSPPDVTRIDVRSALDMQAALARVLGEGLKEADALIMCAAVSDYRPRQPSAAKLKRTPAAVSLDLVPNPDLLAEIGGQRTGLRPYLMGFAVESETGERLLASARGKLANKRVDAVVANAAGDALGTDETRAVIVTASGERALEPGHKSIVAEQIVDFLSEQLA